jgi:hypothetical protein
MRVLLISPYFFPYKGVGAIRMTSLAAYLISQNCEVLVVRLDNYIDSSSSPLPKNLEGITFFNLQEKNFNLDLFNIIQSISTEKIIDKVVISVGPYYTLKLVSKISLELKLKVILDFRDLWIFEEKRSSLLRYVKNKFILSFSYPIELKAIKFAEAVIFVTQGDYKIMSLFYSCFKTNFYLIPNGYYDYGDLKLVTHNNFINNDHINISILGKFSYYDLKSSLFFLNRIADLQGSFKIKHYGEKEEVSQFFSTYKDTYSYCGYVQTINTIYKLRESNLNLIIYPLKTGLGTKVYDYIYANKPILLIGTKKSAIYNLLKTFKNFYFLDHNFPKNWNLDFLVNLPKELDTNFKVSQYSRENSNILFYNLLKV